MGLYAEGTEVPPERSRAEIETMLKRYGATGFASGWDTSGARIMFACSGRHVRFVLPLPTIDTVTPPVGDEPRGWGSWSAGKRDEWKTKRRDSEERRRWRALALAIKAKLEAVLDRDSLVRRRVPCAHRASERGDDRRDAHSADRSGIQERHHAAASRDGWHLMKVLSLRQPWAWMVVHGGKTIENRRWNTAFRGEFLIHAAKGMTASEYVDAREFAFNVDASLRTRLPAPKDLERGGVIGMARLNAVAPPCLLECDVDDDVWCRCGHPWHMGDQFGFVLTDIKPLPFQPMRGMLGLFEAP